MHENAKALLNRYVAAVMTASETQSLTGAKDAKEFSERHVADAQKLLELLGSGLTLQQSNNVRPDPSCLSLRVLDIGSGNGIPGIVFAIQRPLWHVSLLDSNNKKAIFLDTFCKSISLKNVSVYCDRAETLAHKPELRSTFDVVVARALSKLPVAIELSAPFIKLGGMLIVPHGTSHEEELKRSEKAMKEVGLIFKEKRAYSLGSGPEFTALIFTKVQDTPNMYPRRVGIPDKRPL